jgi:hypothetical protein
MEEDKQLGVWGCKVTASPKIVSLGPLYCYRCHTQPAPGNLLPATNFEEQILSKMHPTNSNINMS